MLRRGVQLIRDRMFDVSCSIHDLLAALALTSASIASDSIVALASAAASIVASNSPSLAISVGRTWDFVAVFVAL